MIRPNFNPRTREGCDNGTSLTIYIVADISIHAPVKGATSFQRLTAAFIGISIHAPVKGATMIAGIDAKDPRVISIHAPVKGATT